VGWWAGGALQFIARRYIKNNREFLKKKESSPKELQLRINDENKKQKFRRFLPRGADFGLFKVIGINVELSKIIVNFLVNQGVLLGFLSGSGVVISKIPVTTISTFISKSFSQNLPEYGKNRFIIVKGEKIYVNHCDQNLEYLFIVIND
jgi:hypothetical protein